MIKASREKKANFAIVGCDVCQHSEEVHCDYYSAGKPNIRQIKARLKSNKWAEIKGKMLCPSCVEKRKGEQVTKVTTAPQPTAPQPTAPDAVRAPSRSQRREIISALEIAYDVENERYSGTYTDRTVADEVGNGIMPGWVAQIRDETFGPAGVNEESIALVAEIRAACAENEAIVARAVDEMKASVGKARLNYESSVKAAAKICEDATAKANASNLALIERVKSLAVTFDMRVAK